MAVDPKNWTRCQAICQTPEGRIRLWEKSEKSTARSLKPRLPWPRFKTMRPSPRLPAVLVSTPQWSRAGNGRCSKALPTYSTRTTIQENSLRRRPMSYIGRSANLRSKTIFYHASSAPDQKAARPAA